jgi:hypothetical protein
MLLFGMGVKSIGMSIFPWDAEPVRKTSPKLLRKIVWDRDKGRCKICGKKVDQWNWELGHDKAHSRGGKMTVRNTFVVHPFCNRSQSTQSIRELKKGLGIESNSDIIRKQLKGLTIIQLKYLAKKHKLSVRGTVEEDFFSSTVRAPSKVKYISALSKVATKGEIASAASHKPEPKKRKRRAQSLFSW